MKKISKELKILIIIGTITCLAALLALGHVIAVQFQHRKARENTEYNSVPAIDSSLIYNNEYILVWDKAVSKEARTERIKSLKSFEVTEEFDDVYMVVHCTDNELTPSAIIAKLLKLEGVAYADPNYIMTIDSVTADDTFADSQWALDNNGFYTTYTDYSLGTGITFPIHPDIDINFPEAKDFYEANITDPKPVIVAVIDTGVDINHPELAGHIWINEGEIPDDGIDNDGNGFIDDVYGWDFYNEDNTVIHYDTIEVGGNPIYTDNDNHGTLVAGTIAAIADNAAGIVGAASFAPVKIMVLKSNGGMTSTGRVSTAIRAINYATAMGAQVCNLSWGGSGISSATIASLTAAMQASDALFVCAAGNTGNDNDSTPVYPASVDLPNNISVTYISPMGTLYEYNPEASNPHGSNYGANSVDIAAPGIDISCTYVGGTYGSATGSSVAAPFVSAVAAVLYSTSDGLYASEVKELILSSAKLIPEGSVADPSEPNPLESLTGKLKVPGIVDMKAALEAAASLSSDTDLPELTITRTFENGDIVVTVTATDETSGVRIIRYETIGAEDEFRTIPFFLRGTKGTLYSDALHLDAAARFSFYVTDFAGNEQLVNYTLTDDTTAPTIEVLTTKLSPSGTTLVVLDVSDYESGVKNFLMLPGTQTEEDFFDEDATPTVLTAVDGRLLLRLSSEPVCTILAKDYRGNSNVYVITLAE